MTQLRTTNTRVVTCQNIEMEYHSLMLDVAGPMFAVWNGEANRGNINIVNDRKIPWNINTAVKSTNTGWSGKGKSYKLNFGVSLGHLDMFILIID